MSKQAINMFQTLLKGDEIIGFGAYRVSTSKRMSLVFPFDTIVFDTDTGFCYVGDNVTLGGKENAQGDRWDDLRFPFTQTKQGSNLKPDFDYTNIGLLFPQNDATEIVYIIAQLPHDWKIGSSLSPHIHWVQSGATSPTWKMSYRWYSNGGTIPSFTTVTAGACSFPYTSGSIAQICGFGSISGSSITGVSSIFEAKIYREDNVVSGDVLAKEFDIHYVKDSLGSYKEYVK
jgi:hypothetical protein